MGVLCDIAETQHHVARVIYVSTCAHGAAASSTPGFIVVTNAGRDGPRPQSRPASTLCERHSAGKLLTATRAELAPLLRVDADE